MLDKSKIVEYKRYRKIPRSISPYAQVVAVDERGIMWDIVTEREWKLDETKWEMDMAISEEEYQKLQEKIKMEEERDKTK